MGRADRRRFEKEFAKIMKAPPDNCMACSVAFQHNCKTYGGITAHGQTVLVGECCVQRLASVMGQGLYVTRNFDSVPRPGPKGAKQGMAPEMMTNVVESLQAHFSELDTLSNTLMRQAGLQYSPSGVNVSHSPWKADDAAWFASHPNRSHRLRPLFDGEEASIPKEIMSAALPAKHRIEILVRQIEVGKRVRTVFCRNTEFPIPDSEEVIHAIFDAVSSRRSNPMISTAEIESLVHRYKVAGSEASH